MQQKAFAQFPAAAPAKHHLIDIFAVEAISQSSERAVCSIFCQGSDRYYIVEIPENTLDLYQEPTASDWCLTLISTVAHKAAGADVNSVVRDPSDPRATGPATFHGDPEMPL